MLDIHNWHASMNCIFQPLTSFVINSLLLAQIHSCSICTVSSFYPPLLMYPHVCQRHHTKPQSINRLSKMDLNPHQSNSLREIISNFLALSFVFPLPGIIGLRATLQGQAKINKNKKRRRKKKTSTVPSFISHIEKKKLKEIGKICRGQKLNTSLAFIIK